MGAAGTDLVLAIGHHLLVFALAGILAFEIAVVRIDLSDKDVLRIARVDLWYGIIAAVILVVGFSRVFFAAKGWAYYSHNLLFWAKIGTFAVIGLLSIGPTVSILRWRREFAASPAFSIDADELRRIRLVLFTEAGLFALLPAFAAGMARGYGMVP
jgi:putative membrane protein